MNFFKVGKRKGHYFFIDPNGRLFFSTGMNHLDSASLRYPENCDIWQQKYANSQERWLREAVGPDLRAWGFNTLGWCQEVIIRSATIHRHSRNFIREEYDWLDMPYCHLLPFTEAHQWDKETRLPDVFSDDFSAWCDRVAREHCGRLADDPKLIGYFYCDCPTWVHTQNPTLKEPWFDPAKLESSAGRRELQRMAERYYQVTHDAIRRYDPHHLILGDRYEAKAPLPDEILRAAVPYVDVLSFQFFAEPEEIVESFTHWHGLTGKPILLADACVPGRDEGRSRDQCRYPGMLKTLRELPFCVGWHYCGAYLRNRTRQAGFRDEREQVINEEFVKAVTAANAGTARWALAHSAATA